MSNQVSQRLHQGRITTVRGEEQRRLSARVASVDVSACLGGRGRASAAGRVVPTLGLHQLPSQLLNLTDAYTNTFALAVHAARCGLPLSRCSGPPAVRQAPAATLSRGGVLARHLELQLGRDCCAKRLSSQPSATEGSAPASNTAVFTTSSRLPPNASTSSAASAVLAFANTPHAERLKPPHPKAHSLFLSCCLIWGGLNESQQLTRLPRRYCAV